MTLISFGPWFDNTASPRLQAEEDYWNALYEFSELVKTYELRIEPRGGRGIDRLGVSSFALQRDRQLADASRKCLAGTYRFAPYQEYLVPRGAARPPRQLSVPTLRDRVVLFQLKEFLQSLFPAQVGRYLPNEYIRHIKTFAQNNDITGLSIIRTDIRSFFSTIQHDQLFRQINKTINCPRALDLITRAIRVPTIPAFTTRSERRRQRNRVGVPQGLPVSNVLASIYLADFDEEMKANSLLYRRYVDDMILIVRPEELSVVITRMQAALGLLGLTINPEKTQTLSASDAFEFLGYSIKLPSVTVKPQTVERFLRALAAKFSRYQHLSRERRHPSWLTLDQRTAAFVEDVGETITGAISEARRYGWLFYFLEITDLTLLHRLDVVITRLFSRLSDFKGYDLSVLKRLSRSYYEAKYSPQSGYILNYNKISTPRDMIDFLIRRGIVDPADASTMSVEAVVARYQNEKARRLVRLEKDVGFLY